MDQMMMDHSTMDHSMPDHGMPGHDMPGHDMPSHDDMCSMNMIFTWDWKNTCIIYNWWHIRTFAQFVVSFIAVVVLSMGYEFIKYYFGRWKASNINIVNGSAVNSTSATIRRVKLQSSIFYGLQVGYSFMLMLVFMTYNGWFMIAVVIGAIIGHHLWGSASHVTNEDRSMACH